MENKRHRKSWTVNECIQLEREYDLLKLSITDIAIKHQRTPRAIMSKLDKEGIASYSDLYLQMPEMMPRGNCTSHANNIKIGANIHNETALEIANLLDMQKSIVGIQSQINTILSVIGGSSKNTTKSRGI